MAAGYVVEYDVPRVVTTGIDIKARDHNNVITHDMHVIPVAILSTADFDALTDVARPSLTFGPTGDEESLLLDHNGDPTCGVWDFNHDGLLDLWCLFNNQHTGFQAGDTEGILRGKTLDGVPIEGRDSATIVN